MPISPILTPKPRSKRRSNFPICAACARCCIGTATPYGRLRRGRIFAIRPDFRRGFALLEKHDLHFELQVYAGQAAYAVELIKAFPNVRMILVHAGMLTARTQAAIDQWRAALTTMAAFPNLHVKISGLGMYSSGITLPQARQVIRDIIQIFGVERTIYGSNFPLEKLHASYADFFGVYRAVLSEYHRSRAARGAARQRGEILQLVMLGPRLRQDDNHSKADRRAVQIIFVGTIDLDGGDLAHA